MLGIYLNLIRLATVLIAAWIVATLVDRRPFQNYGFHLDRNWWVDLAGGVLLGALLMTGIFVLEWWAGWITVTGRWVSYMAGIPFALAIWSPLVLFIVVAIAEELLARGNQTLNMTEGLRPLGRRSSILAAWFLSSIIFGWLHFSNPNATWLSTFNLMLAGLFLGVGYLLTGELAFPIGLHFAWNFVQGNVFGFPVSGKSAMGATVIAIDQGGAPLWTGGAFGPEAGLVGVLAMGVGALMTLLWMRYRHGPLSTEPLYARTNPPAVANHNLAGGTVRMRGQ